MRKLLLSMLAILVIATLSACESEPTTLLLDTASPPDSSRAQAGKRFGELAREYTGGQVSVVFAEGRPLHRMDDALEALQLDAIQLLVMPISRLGEAGLSEFDAFKLSYLFQDAQSWMRVTQGKVGQTLSKHLKARGMVGLAYWEGGFVALASRRSISLPKDLKGLSVGISTSTALDTELRALGAIPQAMGATRLHQALTNRTLDVVETNLADYQPGNLATMLPYLTLTHHEYRGYIVLANKKTWDALSIEKRTALGMAMRDATTYQRELETRHQAQVLSTLRQAGNVHIHTLTRAEHEQWHATFATAYHLLENDSSTQWIGRVRAAAAKFDAR